jgi:hypothetical protein
LTADCATSLACAGAIIPMSSVRAASGAVVVTAGTCRRGRLGRSAACGDTVVGALRVVDFSASRFAPARTPDASQVPVLNGWSKVTAKCTVYVLPAPQKWPLVTEPTTSVLPIVCQVVA